MAEPRMRLRQKGQQFHHNELTGFLAAYGDDTDPLPSTQLILDEILTDFIIETCHSAALCASYSRRQKIKVDDFKWVLRRDGRKLGKVAESAFTEKLLKESRTVFDAGDEGVIKKGKGKANLKEIAGVDEEDVGAVEDGEGRKKKKRKAEEK
ncbi:transcription initiation factor IID, 18kD subunit-domain-containing protein [Delphinella strobiligena]|nr:transcription initiation factor IID, 18kD subunit-domain-containing protein [Delphinella strobiligena]